MVRKVAVVVLLIGLYSASVFTINGCGGATGPTEPVSPAQLSGRVTDAQTGAPIRGASVTIHNLHTTTNDSGMYFFGGLVAGSYLTMQVAAEGYRTMEAQFSVVEGNNVQNMALPRP